MTQPTKPTIDEQIEYAKRYLNGHNEFYIDAILANLEKLAAIESQPVPVEPECGRHDIVNDDKYGKIMGSVIGGDYVTYEDWEKLRDSLQSALQRAQEERDEFACHHGWRGTKPDDGERIVTPCPACGCQSLFIGSGGHLTCARVPSDHSDGCNNPGVADAVNALRERAEKAEATNRRMVELLKRFSFLAQTTGGTAGRDDELVKAIDESAELLKEAEK